MLASHGAVLFDLDGTLVDSAGDLTTSVNAMLAEEALPALSETRVRQIIGDGAAELVRRAFAANRREPPAHALDRFRAHYAERCLEHTLPYPGIPELLRDLRSAQAPRRIGVVTNKPTSFSTRIVEGLGLAALIDEVVGPERVRARKPAAEHVLDTLTMLGTRPADAVLVGDGPTDAAAGRRAGVLVIGVTWGYRPRSELELEGVTTFANRIEELRDLLLPAR
jgi:phosphoglycolate phosphatase